MPDLDGAQERVLAVLVRQKDASWTQLYNVSGLDSRHDFRVLVERTS